MAASRTPRPDSNEAIAARLNLLRRAYSLSEGRDRELNKSDFPRMCGIGIQAWHNSEKGINRIGLDNAIKLRARTGAHLEYIYFNALRGQLPRALAEAMDKIEQEDRERPTKRA